MLRRLVERLRVLVHYDAPPRRTALALAVGVFIGCSPFWFFQTLLGLLVATLFRLNKAATVTGVWLNVPWVAPLVYAAALKVGTLILPGSAAPGEAFAALLAEPKLVRWTDAADLFRDLSAAFLVGTTVVGLAAAGLTYVVAFAVLQARRRRFRAPGTDRRRAA